MVYILKDRFTRGLLAGLLAGIIAVAFNLISYLLHFATLTYGDFAAALIFHRAPASIWEHIYAFLIVTMFLSFLGAVFSFIMKIIGSKIIFLKGIVFGIGLWFAIYSLSIMFKLPNLTIIPPITALSNMIGACIWGAALGYFLNLLNRKTGQIS